MICTTIQNKTAEQILEALEQCEMAEVRLDSCVLSAREMEDVFTSDVPLVATCRIAEVMKNEPSLQDLPDATREVKAMMLAEKRLVRAIEAGARYVDVEIEAEKQMTEQILKDIPVAKSEPAAVVVETVSIAPDEAKEPKNLKIPDAPEVLPAPEITKLPKTAPEAVRDSTLLSDMATLFGLEAVKTYITLRAFELGCKRTFGYYSAETYMDEYRELLEKEVESA